MQIEDKIINDILVVTPLDKRLDAYSAVDFKGKMVDWINRGHRRIVLDLSLVDFVDSSGLGTIVSCLKTLGEGGDLVISGIKDAVLSLFQLTRMNRVFQIFPTPYAAIKGLTG